MASATELRLTFGCALWLAACGSGGTHGVNPALGDSGPAPELQVVGRASSGAQTLLRDHATIPIVNAFQGGYLLVVGVRVRNFAGAENATLKTALIEPATRSVLSLEERPVQLALGDDGWFEPKDPQATNDFANLPACPLQGLTRPVDGEEYELHVSVRADDGRTAKASLLVVPTCDSGDAGDDYCRSTCAAGDAGPTPRGALR